jgi:hypothetical protein
MTKTYVIMLDDEVLAASTNKAAIEEILLSMPKDCHLETFEIPETLH